jgi:histone-lysine N-methyltransferase SETMAR
MLLHDNVPSVCPELRSAGQWMWLHDNVPMHRSFRIHQFLAQCGVPVLDHPPYSPDLMPVDFFLFPRLNGVMKAVRFADVAAIEERVTAVLRLIPKEAFADSFQKLYEC